MGFTDSFILPASHADLSSSVAVRPAQSSEQKVVY